MAKNEKISLGEFLRKTRKEKGVSIDEIVRDTNISKKYLENLEENKFSDFPGETYILGFLSTYAEALEIDRQLVVSMYRRQMQIEQDAPLEELVGTRKQGFLFSPTLIAGIVLLISAGVIAIFLSNLKPQKTTPQKHRQSRQLVFSPEILSTLPKTAFLEGDELIISNQDRSIDIQIRHFTSSKSIDLSINNKIYNLKNGETLNIDTDNNDLDDMSLEVISLKNKQALFSIVLITETSNALSNTSTSPNLSEYQDAVLLEKTLFSADAKEPVRIKIQFKKRGWMEYQVDQEESRQKEMKPGENLLITMKDFLTLSLGNAGSASLLINDKTEKGGKLGEINKSIFYWKNENGKFSLIRAFLK